MSESKKLAVAGVLISGAGLTITALDQMVAGAFLFIAGMAMLLAVAEEIYKGENDEQGD